MAWIELHQAVWTHRKTFELSAALGLDETYAAAHVMRLWSWALDNASDGDLSHLSTRVIAYGAGWRAPNADGFVDALVMVGWLDADHRIHDWDEYTGRFVERRKQDAKRKRDSRGHPADVQQTSDGAAYAVRRTVPNPTGPDSTGPSTPPTPPNGGASAAARRTHTRQKSAEPTMAAATPSSLTSEEMAAWTLPPPAP